MEHERNGIITKIEIVNEGCKPTFMIANQEDVLGLRVAINCPSLLKVTSWHVPSVFPASDYIHMFDL